MLYRSYYIDGKKVSEYEYNQVVSRREYYKFILPKAQDYFNRHQYEWRMLCSRYDISTSSLAKDWFVGEIIDYYEETPEGKEALEEWKKKVKRADIFWSIVILIMLGGLLFAFISIFLLGHK